MVNDKDIKAQKSPFAMRQNEKSVFDGKDGHASIDQVVFKVNMGYINEIHFAILEIINEFEFIMTRQIYQLLLLRGIQVKSQEKIAEQLEDLIKSKVISRYYFQSDEGKGIFRVYCLEKFGKQLLVTRNIQCKWVPVDNTKPVFMMKRKLAANQVLLAYMRKVKAFKDFKIEPILVSKKQNIKFKPSLSITLAKDGRAYDFVFDVIRRNAKWAESFIEKLQLYQEFYEYFSTKDCGFSSPPQLVFVGEDTAHLIEAFKLVMKSKVVLKDIQIYYTTDTSQLSDTLEKSLIAFVFDEAKGKYIMDVSSIDLLEPNPEGEIITKVPESSDASIIAPSIGTTIVTPSGDEENL